MISDLKFKMTKQVQIPVPQTRYTWCWIIWAAISAGGFGLIEGYALKRKEHGNTLSVHTRRVLGIYPPRRHRHIGRAAICSFCVWFAHHIAFAPGDDPKTRQEIIDEVLGQ